MLAELVMRDANCEFSPLFRCLIMVCAALETPREFVPLAPDRVDDILESADAPTLGRREAAVPMSRSPSVSMRAEPARRFWIPPLDVDFEFSAELRVSRPAEAWDLDPRGAILVIEVANRADALKGLNRQFAR